MSENKKEAVQDEMLAERFALSCERIAQILQEEAVDAAFRDYFVRTAGLIDLFVQEFHYVADGNLEKAGMEELREHNRRLYEDILPENYGKATQIRLLPPPAWERNSDRCSPSWLRSCAA